MYVRLITIFLVSLLWSVQVFSYFESRYWCTVTPQEITVQMNWGDQKCFSYLAEIDSQITLIEVDMLQAQNYIIRWTDVDYWTLIYEKLERQKLWFTTARDQSLIAINDFELSLFSQIKNLLKFHLSKDKEGVLSDIKKVRISLSESKKAWNELIFQSWLQSMEQLQYRLFLLDRIEFSHDFEELVPFLKEYLYWVKN